MSTLGKTLREAREAKGFSQSKVAAETRILVQIIDDIENEDFHRIAAPIYGRGFVRLFAECVGLDPQPLIREFMSIYAGHRSQTVHVRDVPKPPPPARKPTPKPEPVSDPVPEIPRSAPEPVSEPVPAVALSVSASVSDPVPAIPEPISETLISEPESAAAPAFPQTVPEPVFSPPVSDPLPETVPEPVFPGFSRASTIPGAEPAEPEIPPQITPFAQPPAEPVVEQPKIVRGLDLFEQMTEQTAPIPVPPPAPAPVAPAPVAPVPAPAPAPVAPDRTTGPDRAPQMPAFAPMPSPSAEDSPFLPPSYEDNGPGAAERFRAGLSSVSHGVLQSMRDIPRSTWRKIILILGSAVVLTLIVFGCVKLYQMTTPSAEPAAAEEVKKPVEETSDPDKTAAAKAGKSAKATPAKTDKVATKANKSAAPADKSATKTELPKTPVKLRSTGQKIPSLYVD